MGKTEFVDVEIRILEKVGTQFPVEIALKQEGQEFPRGYVNGKIGRGRSTPQQEGQRLFEWLFQDDQLQRAWAALRAKYPKRRIRLRIDAGASELNSLRWELLRDTSNPQDVEDLAASSATPFSRYLAGIWSPGEPITIRPVRVLVAVANPSDLSDYNLAAVDVEQEFADLQRMVEGMPVELERVPQPCTLAAIEQKLVRGYHVLHIIAHGSFSRRRKKGMLYLADEQNQVATVYEDDFAGMLSRQETHLAMKHALQLIFLASCQTASRDPSDAFRGFAPSLIKSGVPSVIAMQDLVPIPTAQEFSQQFYRRLLEHGQVDLAANEARSLLLTRDLPGAAIPVVFMRSENGQLLAPDPIIDLLKQIDHKFGSCYAIRGSYIPLPIEVIHLTSYSQLSMLDSVLVDTTSSIDLLTGVENTLRQRHEHGPFDKPQLVVLTGQHGSNKSAQLKRLTWYTAHQWLNSLPHARRIVPTYLDLARVKRDRYPKDNPVKLFIFNTLKQYWPTLSLSQLEDLLQDPNGPCFRILIDNSDEYSQRERQVLWQYLHDFMIAYPRHEYLLTFSLDLIINNMTFAEQVFNNVQVELMVIRPLNSIKIRYLLDSLGHRTMVDKNALTLLFNLSQKQLFDLAETPAFLVRMILQARQDKYPETRTHFLQELLDSDLTELPSEKGMRRQAELALCEIAYQMHRHQTTNWPITDAFEVLRQIRGQRDYSLEGFYDQLVAANLLTNVGDKYVRFNYESMQAFCAAKAIFEQPEAERTKLLNDIIAGFGRLNRLRWWRECFVILSGLLASSPDKLSEFLAMIVYGVNLVAHEQTFLAAQCLVETQQHGLLDLNSASTPQSKQMMTSLPDQVVGALLWRVDNHKEVLLENRVRAIQLVSRLASQEILPYLVATAHQKIRRDLDNNLDYDFSSVRLMATLALQSYGASIEQQMTELDPHLLALLRLWEDKNVMALSKLLHQENVGIQGLAALALGDLYGYFTVGNEKATAAEFIAFTLINIFEQANTHPELLWSVAHALALLDSMAVTQQVILPFISGNNYSASELDSLKRHKCIAYLIGQIRSTASEAQTFLVERCIRDLVNMRLWGTAIEALGLLGNPAHRKLLEQIAIGKFAEINPKQTFNEYEQIYLRRQAIIALAHVGDLASLAILRSHRINWEEGLRQIFYRTSEEIYWRVSQQRGGLGTTIY